MHFHVQRRSLLTVKRLLFGGRSKVASQLVKGVGKYQDVQTRPLLYLPKPSIHLATLPCMAGDHRTEGWIINQITTQRHKFEM